MIAYHKLKITLLFFITIFVVKAQQKHLERYNAIDVLNYKFNINLTDLSDEITGNTEVTIQFKKPVTNFQLDLIKNKSGEAKGMLVESITQNGNSIAFSHTNDKLTLTIPLTKKGDTNTYTISYKGIPADGLIISKNKYDERTFFGDNWPDRGKNWLPIIDHPSDKATVEWVITAPSQYQTIGNGIKIEETNISNSLTLTRWRMIDPIPTKVMVIGAARFAVENLKEINNTPVSTWVYPQDRNNGFKDYALALPIMNYFIENIGDYPFKKLANVQSKTRFGGMENAGNIFYSEGSVTGTGSSEALIAHEIAHQWFGNSASEKNWHHVWLSEGFATYFTNLYFEYKYGRDQLIKRAKEQRNTVLGYASRSLVPIVNTTIEDYMQLLNPNSYQKGGWTLHMLRKELGDDLFWKGIRNYYETYKYSNALSEDLQRILEDVSGKSLSQFFKQWLYQNGHPKLEANWTYEKKNLILNINQVQKNVEFQFPLDIKLVYADGSSSIETISIKKTSQQIKISPKKLVTSIEFDPDTWLLFELISLIKK